MNEIQEQLIIIDSAELSIFDIEEKIRPFIDQKAKLQADISSARNKINKIMLDRVNTDGDATPIKCLSTTIYVSSKKPSVVIENEDSVPDDFVKIKRVPDKVKIAKYIMDNNRPEWAKMSDHEWIVNIRKTNAK